MSFPLARLDLILVEIIAQYHLYALPVIVATVVLAAAFRGRREADPLGERERTVRRIGLLNYGLALRAALQTVPEFAGYVEHGAFPSMMIVSVVWPLLTAALHLLIGRGLRKLRRWSRWVEIVFCAFLSITGLLLLRWLWSNGAAFDPADWPELAASKALPLWMLFVMLPPRTARVFSAREREAEVPKTARASAVSLVTLAFLVVVGSVIVVNAADWAILFGARLAGVPE